MKRYHRVKFVRIDEELFMDLFQTGITWPTLRVVSGLPSDAKLQRVYMAYDRPGQFTAIFESDSFDPIESGELIPELKIKTEIP